MQNTIPAYSIEHATQIEAPTLSALLELWENSVRATHTFLSEQDILNLRPVVQEALASNNLSLYLARNADTTIVGFAGVSGDMLEMLFVDADQRRKKIGQTLLEHLLGKGVTRADVNEQNPAALYFYQKMGFIMVGRSKLDGQGNKFPLLHLKLKNKPAQ